VPTAVSTIATQDTVAAKSLSDTEREGLISSVPLSDATSVPTTVTTSTIVNPILTSTSVVSTATDSTTQPIISAPVDAATTTPDNSPTASVHTQQSSKAIDWLDEVFSFDDKQSEDNDMEVQKPVGVMQRYKKKKKEHKKQRSRITESDTWLQDVFSTLPATGAHKHKHTTVDAETSSKKHKKKTKKK